MDFESNIVYLKTSGKYLGMDIEKSEVMGLFVGINYQLLTNINLHLTAAPIIKNKWKFKKGTGDSIYSHIVGKPLETTHYGNVLRKRKHLTFLYGL